ncbi:MAG: cupin domain-containing protein [Anaerolineae bacterium]|nr:MAG: cupin domain-containing protein [Anaerolineae bacterium]
MMTELNLEDRAQSLAGLVEYQPGSVVSRTLLSKATGSVTLFAFDKDQSLSEHTTPYDALVLAVDGELEITIAGDRRRLASGDVLLMPANKPHAVHAIARSKIVLIMVRE